MRDFLLNAEELLDQKAYSFLQGAADQGLFSCTKVYYNDKVQLIYFPDGCRSLTEVLPELSLDELCDIEKAILGRVREIGAIPEISLENIIWDADSIYLDEKGQIFFLCLPAVLPEESGDSQIYVKQIYALLEELLARKDGAEEVCRQIEFQKERQFGDWESLTEALGRRVPEEDETIILKSVNTPEVTTFRIGHDVPVRIGSDPELADGLISGTETVSPLHAVIGWNDISFYVLDKDSANGTFVNNQQIVPNTEVPIGKGTVLRFADCTFSVE